MAVSRDRSGMRAAGRVARNGLVGSDRVDAEQQLISHLQALDASHADSIGLFVAHDGEPDLTPFVQWLWDRDRLVSLPVLNDDPEDHTMRFVPWTRGSDLVAGRFAIPRPPAAATTLPATVLVPFTAFDARGSRLGRGGGFFDRYLATSTATIVGVGFECQRFDSIPVEDHDQSLPIIVTDLGIRFTSAPS